MQKSVEDYRPFILGLLETVNHEAASSGCDLLRRNSNTTPQTPGAKAESHQRFEGTPTTVGSSSRLKQTARRNSNTTPRKHTDEDQSSEGTPPNAGSSSHFKTKARRPSSADSISNNSDDVPFYTPIMSIDEFNML